MRRLAALLLCAVIIATTPSSEGWAQVGKVFHPGPRNTSVPAAMPRLALPADTLNIRTNPLSPTVLGNPLRTLPILPARTFSAALPEPSRIPPAPQTAPIRPAAALTTPVLAGPTAIPSDSEAAPSQTDENARTAAGSLFDGTDTAATPTGTAVTADPPALSASATTSPLNPRRILPKKDPLRLYGKTILRGYSRRIYWYDQGSWAWIGRTCTQIKESWDDHIG
ncbi:MAG: hypothetical protein WC881_05185, partial [Elusimicrobiota bacterium]